MRGRLTVSISYAREQESRGRSAEREAQDTASTLPPRTAPTGSEVGGGVGGRAETGNRAPGTEPGGQGLQTKPQGQQRTHHSSRTYPVSGVDGARAKVAFVDTHVAGAWEAREWAPVAVY